MRVYLAAAWSRKNEIAIIAQELRDLGVCVQSRWLDEPHGGPDDYHKFLRERAMIDVNDVRASDLLVRFTDDLKATHVPSKLATGSRMFEMGYAYAQGKPIIVVGGHQPVFDYLPNIIHLPDVEALKNYLKPAEQI